METGTKGKSNNPEGRPKAIATPEEMLRLFELYAGWCSRNPLTKMDFKGKDADEVHYRIDRPLSWFGFDAFLFKRGIMKHTEDYRQNKDDRYTEFAGVISGIGNIIKAYQVEGALTGILKENLVSRLQGLKEHTDNKTDIVITDETKIGFE